MGHSQSTSEVQIIHLTREIWTKIMMLTVAKMNYGQAMTYNQRFIERREQEYGADSDFARRKAEHEALSRRLETESNANKVHCDVKPEVMPSEATASRQPRLPASAQEDPAMDVE